MNFLPDMTVDCDVCQGRRFNPETLEIIYKGKSIADVLEMTVEEGVEFFDAVLKTPVWRRAVIAQPWNLRCGQLPVGR